PPPSAGPAASRRRSRSRGRWRRRGCGTRAAPADRQLERRWLFADGLPERPWFRNLFAATDPDSGYGAWMLPGLRWAVERKSLEAVTLAIEAYSRVLSRLDADLDALEVILAPDPEPTDPEPTDPEPTDLESTDLESTASEIDATDAAEGAPDSEV
ncbi:MAG: transferrin receptor-like dimerization domain-containing protein, partial [Acidobacteriota bacterium]